MVFQYHLKELIQRKQLLEGRKITQMEIAQKTGIRQSLISRIVNNKPVNLTLQTIIALCEYLDCTIDELISLNLDQTKSFRYAVPNAEEKDLLEIIAIHLQGIKDKRIVKNPQTFHGHKIIIPEGAYLFLDKPFIENGTYAYVKIKGKEEIREIKVSNEVVWLLSPFSSEPAVIYDPGQVWIEGIICMFLRFTTEVNIVLGPKEGKKKKGKSDENIQVS